MQKIIEYDNNGYKFAVIEENGEIHKEGHYDGCIHPKVKKHE